MIIRKSVILSAALAFALAGCSKKVVEPATVIGPDGQVQINPRAEFVAGLKLLKARKVDYSAARERFKTALDIDPSLVNAHFNAGWCSEQLGQYAEASKYYASAYKAKPTKDVLYALTHSLNKSAQSEDAVKYYIDFLTKNPQDKEVRYSLINALTDAKKYDEAVAEFKRFC